MSIEDMIEKLIEFKGNAKLLKERFEITPGTEEVREFIYDIPEQLKRNGFSDDVIEDVYNTAKFVPGNPLSNLESLIEKLRSI